MVEWFLLAFWNQGLDRGDRAVLLNIAGETGLDAAKTLTGLERETDVDAVKAEATQSARMGVNGVPCHILGRRQGMMGAQPTESLVAAMRSLAT
jgi:predicted DsbA family dithiol-disulfide isomerase